MTLTRSRFIMLLLSFLVLLPLCACATSSNFTVGTRRSRLHIRDQREAIKTVKVFDQAPEGYIELGPVDSARCHRNFTETKPTPELVLIDLKVAAYARGADAITAVDIRKKGSWDNCWWVLDGRAMMLSKNEATTTTK